ncbi:Aste57867_294 [Aphanomyces stellatus]|uniref:Amino acid transporter n=1 Tax=Aphanomyces stellatus TaxID=120398 RepID=A0A485K777_9STRA|nr:hypothetical protein As57867_000294 [Aphanomyces stellatus]VFT77520.1 Aste57867_294 [Aphanomyces stellatus]
MNTSRPKIILFSGDLATESPGQQLHTSYTELGHDNRQSKKVDVYDDYKDVYQQNAVQAQKPAALKPNPYDEGHSIRNKHAIGMGVRNNKSSVIGALLGVVIGAILVNWKSITGHDIAANSSLWIGLLGRLYLRAMFCIVIPLVLSSMALSIAEILRIGKFSRIAWRVMAYFLATKVFAVSTGLAMAFAFRRLFTNHSLPNTTPLATMYLKCGQNGNSTGYMTVSDNGSVTCQYKTLQEMNFSSFIMKDTNNVFLKYSDANAIPQTTFAQAVIQLTNDIVPDNMVRAMVSTNILSVAMFAILFGAAVCKNYRQNSTGTHYVMDILRQLNFVCEMLVEWLLFLAPVGVCSLIAGAASTGEPDAPKYFIDNTGYFIMAYVVSIFVYSGIILPLFLYLSTKINPFKYLMAMVPAQIFAFSCSSSAATIPITMRCVASTKEVSNSLSHFVVTLGAPMNKDGTAIFLPLAFIFLFEITKTSTTEPLSAGQYVLLMILSLVSSVVTLPVPNSAPVTLYSIWTTLLPATTFPAEVAMITGITWFVDRFTTILNITGDTVVARIVADQVDETCIAEHDTIYQESAF